MQQIITTEKLFNEFNRIMMEESKFNPACKHYTHDDTVTIYLTVKQIHEVAKSSILPRSYINRYGLSKEQVVHESVAAHTNLVMMLVDRAVALTRFMHVELGYSQREINEVVRIHDLPENEMGDQPDNDSFDEAVKREIENKYLQEYIVNYPANDYHFGQHVKKLFKEMNEQSSYAGRLIYSADKASALIITLTYDYLGYAGIPLKKKYAPDNTRRDDTEISICDYCTSDECCRASEMWTIDHFHIRKLNRFDDSGFFTAIIVMYTLLYNGQWYNWREQDYKACP